MFAGPWSAGLKRKRWSNQTGAPGLRCTPAYWMRPSGIQELARRRCRRRRRSRRRVLQALEPAAVRDDVRVEQHDVQRRVARARSPRLALAAKPALSSPSDELVDARRARAARATCSARGLASSATTIRTLSRARRAADAAHRRGDELRVAVGRDHDGDGPALLAIPRRGLALRGLGQRAELEPVAQRREADRERQTRDARPRASRGTGRSGRCGGAGSPAARAASLRSRRRASRPRRAGMSGRCVGVVIPASWRACAARSRRRRRLSRRGRRGGRAALRRTAWAAAALKPWRAVICGLRPICWSWKIVW